MVSYWLLRRRVLAACALLAGTSAFALGDRNALWLTVQSCKASSVIGLAFPCIEVKAGGSDSQGYVVLRAPLERSHIVVSPTSRVVGLESPDLRLPAGGDYWRAAWGARRYVTEALGGKVSLDNIVLAANSPASRSQDQLHIHADCGSARLRRDLALHGSAIGTNWRILPFAIDGQHYYGRRIEAAQWGRLNPWADLLQAVPALRLRIRQTGMAIAPALGGPRDSAAFLLANADGSGSVEDLQDHACRLS